MLFKSLGCQWVNPSIGLANGLVPSDNRAITQTNFDPDLGRHMASVGRSELINA